MIVEQYIFGDVKVIQPKIHEDARGSLREVYNHKLKDLIPGFGDGFCLEYYSNSKKNVIRGLHYQVEKEQGKLISALSGAVLDVVVDIRKSSPTFGQWQSVELSADNKRLIWVPPGFAHGFQSLEDGSTLSYKCTGEYSPLFERCILWSDTDLNIHWPNDISPILSEKDKMGVSLFQSDFFL